MAEKRMRYPDAPDRCNNCWSFPPVVHLNERAYREGRHRIPTCASCGFRSRVVFSEPYEAGLRIIEEV